MDSIDAKLKIEAFKFEGTGQSSRLVANNIYGDTNEFEVQYNPDNLNLGYGQKIASNKEVGKSENTQAITGKEDDSISFNLLFDTSMSKNNQGNYISVKAAYINNLQKLIKTSDSENEIICKITWGSIISFVGILNNMKVNYTMFSSNGIPLRAKVDLTFSQKSVDTGTSTSDKSNTTKSNKRVKLNPDDYLGLLAELEYGNADKWKDIASANNVDNPRLMNPGDVVTIP